ncbi:MAG: hypothetical protein QXY40_02470 [Candidatus Methanomethylicia archaeon]
MATESTRNILIVSRNILKILMKLIVEVLDKASKYIQVFAGEAIGELAIIS